MRWRCVAPNKGYASEALVLVVRGWSNCRRLSRTHTHRDRGRASKSDFVGVGNKHDDVEPDTSLCSNSTRRPRGPAGDRISRVRNSSSRLVVRSLRRHTAQAFQRTLLSTTYRLFSDCEFFSEAVERAMF